MQNDTLSIGIQITLDKPDDFLKVRESLTRIGIANNKDMRLVQSCHILHKKGQYFITHFKELFLLDGKPSDISDDDLFRRDMVVSLLQEWGLINVVNPALLDLSGTDISKIKIIPFREKSKWTLVSKYSLGNK